VSVSGDRRPVPLLAATFEGDQLTVPYSADQIAAAPNDQDASGALRTSAELLDHYGIADAEIRDDTGNPADAAGHASDGGMSRDPRDPSVKADDASQGHP